MPTEPATPTIARSDLFTAADATRLLEAVQVAASSCRSLPGYCWLTAQRLDDSDSHTVTSFWVDQIGVLTGEDAAGPAAEALDEVARVSDAAREHSDLYVVHRVARITATEPGYRVTAHSVAFDPSHEAEAVAWAEEASRIATTCDGVSLAIVETAPGPRVVSVTTWRDERSRQRGADVLGPHYAAAPHGVSSTDHVQRVGTVTFTLAADG